MPLDPQPLPPAGAPSAEFHLGGRPVGERHPPLLIAEIAQAHDGSLGMAHAYIDAAAAGAQAIKFQTHLAAAESTPAEPWRVRFSPQDATRYDYWRRMEFTLPQWQGLRQHAEERGLLFLSSPFSLEAVEWLLEVGVPAWKVASGEVANTPQLRRLAATGRPVLLSSGMSDWAELDAAVAICRNAGAPFAVFQCTSAYPAPPERTGLNVLAELRGRYGCPVGLSDHSGKIFASLAAAAAGASLIEVHLAFSKQMFGPDVASSLVPADLALLAEGLREIHVMRTTPVDKNQAAAETAALKRVFGKSVVARIPLPAGTVLAAAHLALKKPGTGIPAAQLESLPGRRLRVDVAADAPLRLEDLE